MKTMKNIVLSIILSLSVFSSFAAADSRIINGNAAYSNNKFDEAIALYEDLLKTQESAALYYNLGNAYYKSSKLAPAILNYERAILLNPNDDDIKSNLELAKLQTVDKDESAVDQLAISEWTQSFVNLHSSNTWARMSIIFFLLTLACASLYLYVKVIAVRKLGFIGGILTFLICFVSFFCAKSAKEKITTHEYAIVFTPSVTAKSSPKDNATDALVLHEGTKVLVKQQVKDWYEIETSGGHRAWIKTSDAEKI